MTCTLRNNLAPRTGKEYSVDVSPASLLLKDKASPLSLIRTSCSLEFPELTSRKKKLFFTAVVSQNCHSLLATGIANKSQTMLCFDVDSRLECNE